MAAIGAPSAAAVPISATPIVPADPHEVPVARDISAVARNAVSTSHCGLMNRTPQYTRYGIVPDSTQVAMSIPIASRIRIAGSTSASFWPVARWTSSHPCPCRAATSPATAADASNTATSSSPLSPIVNDPSRNSPSMVMIGARASPTDSGASVRKRVT